MSETVSTKRNRVYAHKYDHDLARDLREDGATYKEIAEICGASESSISILFNKKAYAENRANSMRYQSSGVCIGCGGQCSRGRGRASICRACSVISRVERDNSNKCTDTQLICSKCGEMKDDEQFTIASSSNLRPYGYRRGRRSHCKPCDAETRRNYRRRMHALGRATS